MVPSLCWVNQGMMVVLSFLGPFPLFDSTLFLFFSLSSSSLTPLSSLQ